MKKMWSRLGWAGATLPALALMWSCGSNVSGGATTPPTTHDGHDHDELAFLSVGTRAEIEQQVAAGDVELRPGFAFQGILLHITSYERFDVELSYERLDGSRSAFFPVEPEEPEYPFAHASAILPEQAVAIFLRVKEGHQSIEFLAARFYKDLPVDGQFAIHDDYDPAIELGEEVLQREGQLLTRQQAASRPGRWIPTDQALSGGSRANFRYEGAPAWNRAACGNSFSAGARDLAEHLVRHFGASSYGGFSCRPNTANASQMSVHGTGRAFDLFYPLHNRDADNDKGDPAANWLLENASQIGVQLVIWDRTSWSVGRSGHRQYSGPHPHHDHLHVEVTSAAANRQTPFFGNPGVATNPNTSGVSPGGGSGGTASNDLGGNLGAEGGTCMSSTLGRRVPVNTCVQMAYVKYGGRCNWARCSSAGTWVEQSASQCPGAAFANASCGGQNAISGADGFGAGSGGNAGASCHSQTLSRVVSHGTCVQVNYQGRTCSRCGRYSCQNGAWVCTSQSSCSAGSTNPHSDCGGGTTPDPNNPNNPNDPNNPNEPHVRQVDGAPVGNFKMTFYWLAMEADHPGTKNVSLPKCGGGELAKVSQAFLDAARLQGSGKLEDGRVINVGSSTSCFVELDKEQFPWGKGSRNNALEPLRSIATDPFVVPTGNTVYIGAFDGLEIPKVGELGGFTHDGCFRADDVGGKITGYHFDFYAGTNEMYKQLVSKVPSPVLLSDRANGKCAKYKK